MGRLAGVSPATASRVLTGSARVSRAARRRVEDAVEQLGYVRRNSAARPLPGAVAVVIREDGARLVGDAFHARMLWGVRRELSGVAPVLVLMTSSPDELHAAAEYLRGGRVEGVLLVGAHEGPGEIARAVCGAPVVLAERPPAGTALPYVGVDDRGGARDATRHLLESGRRRVATIAGPADRASGADRLDGYREAAGAAGMDTSGLVGRGDFGARSGELAMRALLARRPDADAVLAASDAMAAGALRALRRAGRRVPDDVAVVGFDDAPIARRTRPPLTTVRRPAEELGVRLARELRARMDGRTSTDRAVLLRTRLVVRASG
ncbi:LacI family DNA-binding transcriptional regulator [Actinomadura gamaensis]|uniref:LacI family DNA-binding transcriptional regulator n=1 Tax=Actinomadura gamaensis TaxID=1763541 RepID=A0ABV9U0V3_9ACTN